MERQSLASEEVHRGDAEDIFFKEFELIRQRCVFMINDVFNEARTRKGYRMSANATIGSRWSPPHVTGNDKKKSKSRSARSSTGYTDPTADEKDCYEIHPTPEQLDLQPPRPVPRPLSESHEWQPTHKPKENLSGKYSSDVDRSYDLATFGGDASLGKKSPAKRANGQSHSESRTSKPAHVLPRESFHQMKQRPLRKARYSRRNNHFENPWNLRAWLEWLTSQILFDGFCALVIVLNAILIGLDTQTESMNSGVSMWQERAGYAFSTFFLIELLLRVGGSGTSFFYSDGWRWNWFDTLLVIMSIVELIFLSLEADEAGTYANVGSRMKTLKMMRIARVFRLFRFCREFTTWVLMIVDSFTSLMWAILMLMLMIYVFTIFFTQQANHYRSEATDSDDGSLDPISGLTKRVQVEYYFGSLPKTAYTLVQAMLGGVSWGVVSDAALWISLGTFILYMFYISFALLAVLNIITGVFVENAFESAKSQREFQIQAEMEQRHEIVCELGNIFDKVDVDKRGTLSLDEIAKHLENEMVVAYFHSLGLDPDNIERLFALLDTDGSGEVSCDEFLDGCVRLKGAARSIDVHTIIFENKRLHVKVDALMNKFGIIDELDQSLRESMGHVERVYSMWPAFSNAKTSGEERFDMMTLMNHGASLSWEETQRTSREKYGQVKTNSERNCDTTIMEAMSDLTDSWSIKQVLPEGTSTSEGIQPRKIITPGKVNKSSLKAVIELKGESQMNLELSEPSFKCVKTDYAV